MSKQLLALPLLIYCIAGCNSKPREDPDLTLRKKLFSDAASELPTALAAAKKAGLFTLLKYKPIPASQNAAPLYKHAFLALKDVLPPNYPRLIFSSKAKPKDIEAALRSHKAGLELIRQAPALPKADFGPMTDGWELNPDWLLKFSGVRRLLLLDAHHQLNNGDKAAAIEDLRSIVRMTRQTCGDERFQPQTRNLSASDAVNTSIQKSIGLLDDPESIRQLLELVKGEPATPGLKAALPHELASIYYNISSDLYRVISNPDSPVNEPFSGVAQAIQGVDGIAARDAFRARLLQLFVKLAEVESRKGLTAKQKLASAYKISSDEMGRDATYSLNSSAISNQFIGFYQTWLSFFTQKDVTLVGLRILANQKAGQWPKALPKDSPLDPFTDAPLHYRFSSKGFIVYSVGEEHRDNLGENTESSINISFRYPQNWKVVPDKPQRAKK